MSSRRKLERNIVHQRLIRPIPSRTLRDEIRSSFAAPSDQGQEGRVHKLSSRQSKELTKHRHRKAATPSAIQDAYPGLEKDQKHHLHHSIKET
jgi:hypothetical protein